MAIIVGINDRADNVVKWTTGEHGP